VSVKVNITSFNINIGLLLELHLQKLLPEWWLLLEKYLWRAIGCCESLHEAPTHLNW
jgi:hypothetical protein